MSQSDIEHFATLISGCESITSGGALTDDGRYAFSVLKLHVQDMGGVAGQESIIDNIKRSAKNTKEWVMKIIKLVVEAIYVALGGRAKVKAKITKFKRAVTPEIFQNKTKRAAEDIIAPGLAATTRVLESIIEHEYQDFHNNILTETSEIRAMFIDNNALENAVAKKLKEAETNPTESTLDLSEIMNLLNRSVNKCKTLLTDLLKDEHDNRATIKNLTSVMGKYNRIIDGLTLADGKLDEMFK